MDDFGNGVAVKALQDDFDLVDVLWCAALEAAQPRGVVDAGVRPMTAKPRVVPRRTP
jgi:hypothetical protein